MKNGNTSYFRIGEAAHLTGTKTSQLRFYEQIGILSPGKRDETSEYRLYSYDQLVEIETIVSIQELGFTLKQIKSLLSDRDMFLEQSCHLSHESIKKIDETIEHLKSKRECIVTFHALCSAFLSEYNLKNYSIESIPKHKIIFSGRNVRLDLKIDAKEMLETMNLEQIPNPIENWYMSVYAYKIKIVEDDLSAMNAELCVILNDDTDAETATEELERLYAKTTQAIHISDIPKHIEKLMQLIQQVGLKPLPYYYVLMVAKDKSGNECHIRQIRIPIQDFLSGKGEMDGE